MSFEKYGNKLINLLSRLENKLDPTDTQIGGADPTGAENIYFKELSAGSILVHLKKDGNNATVLKENSESDGKYSVEQQLRLGCDSEGNMYKYSVVLTLHPKKEIEKIKEIEEIDDAKTALGELSEGLRKLAAAAEATSQ